MGPSHRSGTNIEERRTLGQRRGGQQIDTDISSLKTSVQYMTHKILINNLQREKEGREVKHAFILAKSAWKQPAIVRACNSVKFETGQTSPPVRKIVTRTAQLSLDISHYAKHTTGCSTFSMVHWTTGFYLGYTLLLKPLILMHSWLVNSTMYEHSTGICQQYFWDVLG